ncbi:MAG TPA: hypothetical protein VLC53_15440, partial [Myxococcota bacterium]|nr:hypothetical protein [Myxococcota bacterium]
GFFGTLAAEGATTLTSLPVGEPGSLEIETYRSRGVLIAVKADGATHETRLGALAIDRDAAGLDTPALLIERDTDVSGEIAGLCRIPGDAAEGDFLLAEEGFFDAAIRLEAWRSAPRQASLFQCGEGLEGALAIVPPCFVWRRVRRTRR